MKRLWQLASALFLFAIFSSGVLFAQEYDINNVNNNGVANYPHEMTINADDYPIIVYQDTDDGDTTKVKEWNGGQWVYMWASSLPTVASTHHDIAVGTDGLPVVIYVDTSKTWAGRLSIIKWDGSQWNYLWSQWINDDIVARWDGIWFDHVRIWSDNRPVVEYSSWGINVEAWKWNGTSWDNIWPVSDNATGATQYQSLAINAEDTPYIAYLDNTLDEVVIREYSGGNRHDFGNHVTGDNLEWVMISINDDGEVFAFVRDDHGFRTYGLLTSSTGSTWADFGSPVGDWSTFLLQDMVINPFDWYPVVAYKSSTNVSDGDGWWISIVSSKVSRWNGSEWLVVSSEVLDSTSQNLAVNDLGQIYLSQWWGNTYFINPFFRGYFGVTISIYRENLYNPLLASTTPTNGPATLIKGVPTIFTITVPSSFEGSTVLSPWGTKIAAVEKEANKIVYNVIGFKSRDGIVVSIPEGK